MTVMPFKDRPFLPLATARLLMRPVQKSDAEAITQLANNYNVSKTMARVPYPYAIEDATSFIALKQVEFQNGTSLVLSILNRTSGDLMGVIGYEGRTLGYWLGESFWGQGFMKEASRAFVHFLFDMGEIPSFDVSAMPTNLASIKVIEGLGCTPTHQKAIYSNATQSEHSGQYYTLTRERYWAHYRETPVPILWVTAAALLNDEKKLLVTERPPGKSLAGIWELPGGKIEAGESPEDALARELHEELGIDVSPEDLEPLTFASYRYETFHLVMPFFTLRKWKGTLHGKEGQRMAWISYKDLVDYPTPSADIRLFHTLYDVMAQRELWE